MSTVSSSAWVDTHGAGIDDVLADVAAGRQRILLIEAAAGLGKTTLLRQLAHSAQQRGFAIASARLRPDSRRTPGAAIAEALGNDRTTPSAAEVARWLSHSGPAALVLDDAHFLDDGSARVLAELAHLAHAGAALIAVAFRPYRLPGALSGSLLELGELQQTRRLTLAPLTDVEGEAVVRAMRPDAEPRFCAECVWLAAGNPFLLSELVAWVAANRLDPVAGSTTGILKPLMPRGIRRFFSRQLDELGADALALAATLAWSEQAPSLPAATRIAGLDPQAATAAADLLLDNGLIAASDPLRFRSPLAATCVRAETPPALASELCVRAADVAAEQSAHPAASARHLLMAPPAGNPRVVERLTGLADREVEQGNTGAAATLLRRALDEDVDDLGAKASVRIRLGHVHLLQAHPTSAVALATSVPDVQNAADRAGTLLELGIASLAAGSARDAVLAFDSAREAAPPNNPRHAFAEASSAAAALLVPERQAAAAAEVERLLDAPGGKRSAREPELLVAAAWRRLAAGDPYEPTLQLLQRALSAQPTGDTTVGGYHHAALSALLAVIGEHDAAAAAWRAGHERARAAGSRLAERNLEASGALALVRRGYVREAAAACRPLLDSAEQGIELLRPVAAALLAVSLYETEATDDAMRAVAVGLQTAGDWELGRLLLQQARATICLARGELAQALAATHESEQLARALEIANPVIVPWQLLGALCYAHTGNPGRAAALLEEGVDAAETFGKPEGIALSLRIKAQLADPKPGLEQLERASELVRDASSELERAKVLIAYGEALHRLGRNRSARAFLRRGIDTAERIGATRASRLGLRTLIAAGGRPRRRRITGPDSLTPAERRVVALARAGARNRDIAEQLVITEKTVEWHLSRGYAKLGISSRAELRRKGSLDREKATA